MIFFCIFQLEDKLYLRERLYLNVDSMKTCAVNHFRKSYALAMEFTYQHETEMRKFKLSYSGDTGPSDDFVKLGQNSDLLIHEATYENEAAKIAQKMRHSSTAMAIEQGQKMKAKHTILTHFSKQYHFIPNIEGKLDDKTSIAFDYMEITPDDLPRLNSLYAKYKECFPANADLKHQTYNYSIDNGMKS